MNERTEFILRRILDVLNTMPAGQCSRNVLRASVDLMVRPNTLDSEFREAEVEAERAGWIIGIRPNIGPIKWTLTDTGKAEYLKSL